MHISKLAARCNLGGMDISEIRRKNIIGLLNGRTKSACAELWGTSPSYLSQMLSDSPTRNVGDVMARRIEVAELLPHGWLDQVHEGSDSGALSNVVPLPVPRRSELDVVGGVSPWGSETPLEDDEVEIPLYKEVELSAGNGMHAIQEVPGRYIRLSRQLLRDAGVQPSNAVAATISGNSMQRMIMDGATVAFDIGAIDPVDGEIYVINHDGLLRVKYLYRQPGNGLRLRSENAEEYPDEFYTSAEVAESIRIIGCVFWWATTRTIRRRTQ